ncbi:5-carboxymethyl-2-hydroxymuconate Delta-isomerase [Saliniradius amylolyticus]|uniref:5-carboxymethyl-2-hydroxymuconate Delta-isomerase n=1 Tax=Saliniradius amylolyticus TaxID=2183582 RepID=A0A2S2E3R6_9ALTE|nr:fumarylacetoacetate hydrolase family protein [Saliniradius amylolyticus]AWL12291.1 5-carboxymethyl-2-hydroxymuconate Delta-isomerase [Saliniradius amylolyticus]
MRQHHNWQGQGLDLPVGKAVCVGRNYLDHIRELSNEVPEEALLFIKPASSLCDMHKPFAIPVNLGACHNELEVAVLIEKPLRRAKPEAVEAAVWGYGLALDLTLRDVQSGLKAKGHPWERAKAFDGSCPVSGFVPKADIDNPQQLAFNLHVNGDLRQQGNTAMMMRSIEELLAEISRSFTLQPGDIVLTGTPKGVGPLTPGDTLTASLAEQYSLTTKVKADD